MVTDPIGDFLIRIKNASMAKKKSVSVPYSRMRHAVASVLAEEGYLESVKKEGDRLMVQLAYARRRPVLTNIKLVSTPGLRVYRRKDQLPSPLGGAGVSIVSTSAGVMSDKKAKKKRLGGQVIALVW